MIYPAGVNQPQNWYPGFEGEQMSPYIYVQEYL